MEDKNNQINNQPTLTAGRSQAKPNEENAKKNKNEPLIEYENGWTVEDTMALYPELTEEEAIIAHRMGW